MVYRLILLALMVASCQPFSSREETCREIDPFYRDLARAALERTRVFVIYDPSYYPIPYPGGDVPEHRGVCTDVVIRSYRKLGIDLQREVHRDMKSNFHLYPKKWGLSAPDPNIDHRRVPNLMVFFTRKGTSLPMSLRPEDYHPGEIVTWDLGGGKTHTGILICRKSSDGKRWLVVHNIGLGPRVEDILFKYRIIGHYRYGKKP
jgi:hypothetical protein